MGHNICNLAYEVTEYRTFCYNVAMSRYIASLVTVLPKLGFYGAKEQVLQ